MSDLHFDIHIHALVFGYIREIFENTFDLRIPYEIKQLCMDFFEYNTKKITISFMRDYCNVGQSSLISRYIVNHMDVEKMEIESNWRSDLFGYYYQKIVYKTDPNDMIIKIVLDIIDMARSQCEFSDRDRREKLFELSDCIVFGYDLSDTQSLLYCEQTIESLCRYCYDKYGEDSFTESKKQIKILCGYKSDIKCDDTGAKTIDEAWYSIHCKTSALQNVGVEELFDKIIYEYLNIHQDQNLIDLKKKHNQKRCILL